MIERSRLFSQIYIYDMKKIGHDQLAPITCTTQQSLQWRHNERDSVSNHQPHDCLPNRSTVYSGADQRKYQSSASLAFVKGIHRWSVNSPHKGPVSREVVPFDDITMSSEKHVRYTDDESPCGTPLPANTPLDITMTSSHGNAFDIVLSGESIGLEVIVHMFAAS